MTLQWLLSWWNLIFILPFGLGLLYLGMYTISGVTFGDAGPSTATAGYPAAVMPSGG